MGLAPGCVYPSMMTGSVKEGSGEAGAIVCTPLPGMLKVMRLSPAVALDVCIAHRSEPTPVSLTVVIVNVAVIGGGPEAPGMKPLSILVLDDCAEPLLPIDDVKFFNLNAICIHVF